MATFVDASTRFKQASNKKGFVEAYDIYSADESDGSVEPSSTKAPSSAPSPSLKKRFPRDDAETPKRGYSRSEADSTAAESKSSDNESEAADIWTDLASPSKGRWADVDLDETFDYDRTRAIEPPPVAEVPRPATARTPLRTKLSSTAKMWQPGAAAADPTPEDAFITGYEAEVASIVNKVRDALKAEGVCSQVDILSSGVHEGSSRQSWGIIAKVRATALLHTAFLLTLAKEVILGAAEESECTYVSGYNNDPFELRPQGFKATLCGMKEESQACWDIFADGVCRRGKACRWQHPAATSQMAVIIIAE